MSPQLRALFYQVKTHLGSGWKQAKLIYPMTFLVLTASQSLILFGLWLGKSVQSTMQQWGSKMQISIDIKSSATASEVEALRKQIQNHPEVKKVDFFTQEQVQQKFASQVKNYLPELAEDKALQGFLTPNFQIAVHKTDNLQELLPGLANQWSKHPAVESVSHSEDWVQTYTLVAKFLKSFALILFTVLVIASGFILTALIRHSLELRRPELEVLELVGASPLQVRIPFLFEALFLLLASSVSSTLVVFFLHKSLTQMGILMCLSFLPTEFFKVSQIVIVQGSGIALGMVAVALTLRKKNSGWAAKERLAI